MQEWAKTVGGGHEWLQVQKAGDLDASGKRVLVEKQGGGLTWEHVKGSITQARERRERHELLRRAKSAEWFKRGKNIAAKRHAAKKKGVDFETPPKPAFGELSPGGKFKWMHRRNTWGREVIRDHMEVGTWKLLRTEDRPGNKPVLRKDVGLVEQARLRNERVEKIRAEQAEKLRAERAEKDARFANAEAYFKDAVPADAVTVDRNTDGQRIRRASGGMVMVDLPMDKQPSQGIFQKSVVHIEGDGFGVLKSDGIDKGGFGEDEIAGLRRGFAYREVAAYQISEVLGLGIVPKTEAQVVPTAPVEPKHGSFHSLQTFVGPNAVMGGEMDAGEVYDHLADKEEVSRMLMFDVVIGNPDRHAQNWMVTGSDIQGSRPEGKVHVHAIDNGLAMVEDTTGVERAVENWRCGLRHNWGAEKPKLSSKYRDALRRSLDDGSLERIVRDVEKHTLGTRADMKAPKIYADATMARAENLYLNWYSVFRD